MNPRLKLASQYAQSFVRWWAIVAIILMSVYSCFHLYEIAKRVWPDFVAFLHEPLGNMLIASIVLALVLTLSLKPKP